MSDRDAIARRAYELYLQRGSEPGHELEDWLQAEVDLAANADPPQAFAHEEPAAPPARAGRRAGNSAQTARRAMRP